jgi:DNA gyrase subunit B
VAELYLVEGNSAGGSAKDARDRTYQAILPLRGKVINAEKNRINKVLSNTEVQAMITAIGTGIGDEFDIARLRYNRVIVMTDADVDGSHIRTLLLTFLYRNMRELVERGHVYIAVPPLYRVKLGNQEFYFEKDAQLEELLVLERVEDIDILARGGSAVKMSPSRWHRFVRSLVEYEGWLGRLRADFGNPAAEFAIHHRLVEQEIESPAEIEPALTVMGENGYALTLVASNDDGFDIKVVERATGAARTVRVPTELLASPIYGNLRRSYAKLVDAVGSPPFALQVGKKRRVAETFPELRRESLELAKEGVQLSRFKGLGEMNADELRETTMDPAKRMLIQVEVEDATAADAIFSMLMGDQVEPRREFIEQNAKDVRFLDV